MSETECPIERRVMTPYASAASLVLSGDENNNPQELATADVNHLRRLLAWLVCEYNLSDEGQRGLLIGLDMAVSTGAEVGRAQEILDQEVARIERVPAYVRQAVKMLRKAVRDHDSKTGMVNSVAE